MKGFRDFIMRGNVVDMAVGIVIGAAFGAVVTALVDGFIDPLIKVFTGGGEAGGRFMVNGVPFNYGAFISAIVYFLLVAAVVYFLIVLPVNKLRERVQRGESPAEPAEDVQLLMEIRDELKHQREQSAP
ncbi:MAG: large conductance mechanosensitive channel protein MscL [Streptosporangiales bacterium]|nr:large conductance mechanosensitive channel protein MscL [Streptosporangiales bacterium]